MLTKLTQALRKAFKTESNSMGRRKYGSGHRSPLDSAWGNGITPINGDIRDALLVTRARSRDLAQNNDYVKRFLRILENNVVGPHGIKLQCRITDLDGTLDEVANAEIESNWKKFIKKKNFDVAGRLSLRDALAVYIRTMAIDGEVFVRRVKYYANSEHKYAIQFIDPQLIDEQLNMADKNILMGIQYDAWQRPINYYVKSTKEFNTNFFYNNTNYIVVPAAEMHHGYLQQHVSQGRGMPWLHTVMKRLKHLQEYEQAELVAARTGASTMGFLKSADGSVDGFGEEDATGEGRFMDADPGSIHFLPEGYSLEQFDPKHPGGNYGVFIKACLRGISAGLEVSYTSLANDLESVNYSSIRAGMLDERDVFKTYQEYISENFLTEVFEEWLEIFLTLGISKLPLRGYDKFNKPTWQARGWDWVDPLKDIAASIEALNAGLTTRREIIESQGGDFEEVLSQLKQEQDLIEKYGVEINNKDYVAAQNANTNAKIAEQNASNTAQSLLNQQDNQENVARALRSYQTEERELLMKVLSRSNIVEIKNEPITLKMDPIVSNINITQERAEAPVVHVNVPEQLAPVINVAAPNVTVEAPEVNIEATMPTPEVVVQLPARKTDTQLEYNDAGDLIKTTQVEVSI
jgi:lambda family phage portal protein